MQLRILLLIIKNLIPLKNFIIKRVFDHKLMDLILKFCKYQKSYFSKIKFEDEKDYLVRYSNRKI
jgi:hypothetical protein